MNNFCVELAGFFSSFDKNIDNLVENLHSLCLMNNKTLERIVEISVSLKPAEIPRDEHFHLCFAVKKGKIIGIGKNDYNKRHNSNRFGEYLPYKTTMKDANYIPCRHAEAGLAIKLGLDSWSGLEIVNVRLNNRGELRLAKPCMNCQSNIIDFYEPKRVFYSDTEGNFKTL